MLLSVIIPLAPQEHDLQHVHTSLAYLPTINDLAHACEIIFVRSKEAVIKTAPFTLGAIPLALITSPKAGRAPQMNAGALAAKGQYLWFVHADSQFNGQGIHKLLQAIANRPHALHYFDLKFLHDATPLMRLNEWGVHVRSRLLSLPFGDQGLCISRTLFQQCGGYQEHLAYGEDHVFVWQVMHYGLPICSVKEPMYTSARKYRLRGWLKTTVLHISLWVTQALPQFIKLLKIRYLN